ncbi:MAG TPA: 50S ribosomal protein L17 [Bacteroidia bacterium]
MRHGKKINHLGRKSQHRQATLSNMATSLILHKRINTTLAKAKALKKYFEPIITRAKNDTTHSRRMVFRYLQNKNAVIALFRDVAPKVGERAGGYTRILKTGFRLGDNANTCLIELVDFNENMLKAATQASAPAKKTRRGKKKEKPAAKPEAEQTTAEGTTAENDAPKSE